MDSVSPRQGCDDYVPAVRTEPDDCNPDGDCDNTCKPAHPRLHQSLAHAPLVLDEKRGRSSASASVGGSSSARRIDSRSTTVSASTFVSRS